MQRCNDLQSILHRNANNDDTKEEFVMLDYEMKERSKGKGNSKAVMEFV